MATPAIGPTFGSELEAAGLAGLPITWTQEGAVTYHDGVTDAQRQAVEAVLAAHDPASVPPDNRSAALAQIEALEADAALPESVRALGPLLRRLVGAP